MNAYLNSTNANQIPRISIPNSKFGFANNLDLTKKLGLIIFLNFDKFTPKFA